MQRESWDRTEELRKAGAHMNAHAHTCTHMHTHAHTCTHMHTHIHTHAHK